jgi:glucan phosphoethanolaminetransferase (alkaline phosphatase superfamily)
MKLPVLLRNYRSELVMWVFISLLFVSPLADVHPRIGLALALAFFVTVLYGSTFMAESKIVIRFVLPLAGLWMLTHLLEVAFLRYYYSPYVGLLLNIAVVIGILTKFEAKKEVTRNLIAEAVISYLVIAVGFSQVYWILNRSLPNSFNPPVPANEQSTYLYFSLTTLTTVGFGDIQPANHYVRFVAAFEGVVGVFYLAVVIARLVSGYRSGRE